MNKMKEEKTSVIERKTNDEGGCPFFYVASRDAWAPGEKCMACDSETYAHPIK